MARLPNAADLLTLEEAAEDAGYSSPTTLRKAAREGRLQVTRHGRRTILTTAAWVSAYEDSAYGNGGRPRGYRVPAKAPQPSAAAIATPRDANHG
jgi:hypothetical protein